MDSLTGVEYIATLNRDAYSKVTALCGISPNMYVVMSTRMCPSWHLNAFFVLRYVYPRPGSWYVYKYNLPGCVYIYLRLDKRYVHKSKFLECVYT